MKISVIGTGYVGLVTGVVLASLGNDVLCVDKDPAKLEKIGKGISPIYEPGLEELLARTLKDGFFSVSESITEAVKATDIVFIAVGTPPSADGTPDLTAVKEVAKEISRGIERFKLIVNKSTVPVGSGDLVTNIMFEQGVPRDQFEVVSNPEFLREGSAISDTLHPDRIVLGTKSARAEQLMKELYAPLESPFCVTDLYSAELIKYASNSFLAMKISFINAMSVICEACGADIGDVAKGMGGDGRIGPSFLQAGLGWGGSCFPKDVQGMVTTAKQYGYDFDLLTSVRRINDDQTSRLLKRIDEKLGDLKGKQVGLLGLAFKANTDDIRDAKSLVIIQHFLAGGAAVKAYDPVATENVRSHFPQVQYCQSPYEAASETDAIVIVTEWSEFKQLDLERLSAGCRTPNLFDGRRLYDRKRAEAAGFYYFAIGSKNPAAS